jgi:hypothetical protein
MQILGTGKQRAGKTSRILVGTTPLAFSSWENTVTKEDYGTVNFESYNVVAGDTYDEGIGGPIACSSRAGGDWDAGTNPLGNPPGLYPRDELAQLAMFVSRLDATEWLFPFFRVRSSVNGTDVRGKVSFNFSGMNQGPFSWPTGSV